MIDGFKYRGLPRLIYARHVWNSFSTLDPNLIPKKKKTWKMWYADQTDLADEDLPQSVDPAEASLFDTDL